MNVGLVGYYKKGNYGDELFLTVFQEVFHDFRLTVLPDFSKQPIYDPALVAAQDCVIIGGGDLVIPYAFAHHYWDDSLLTKPVVIVGVGVPAWGGRNETAISRMRGFFQHENVKLIIARDQRSSDWIIKDLRPNVLVHHFPDIVTALNFQAVPHHGRRLGIVLRADQNIDYENLKRLLTRAVSFGYDIRNIVLATGLTAQQDLGAAEQLGFPFTKLVVRETIDELTHELAQCDVVVSQKFHACVVATMMGIPSISLSKSDKFWSFFRLIRKEMFLSLDRDPELPFRLIDPMYEIAAEQRLRIKSKARAGLLLARDAVQNAATGAPPQQDTA